MKTKKIFDLDSYVKENKTRVISCEKSSRENYEGLYEVIVEATIFAPEGGGQLADKGYINECEVVDVQEMDGEIIHFVKQAFMPEDEIVESIDFDLRFRRMQNHNAEHLLCGIIHKKYGYSNVGFHITETVSEDGKILLETTMDVDGPLSLEQINEIEMEANRAIAENVPVYAMLPSVEEAKSIQYRSKLDIEEGLRLVVIEGYDICACCAPCLKQSSEMQLVKVLNYMPHRGGTRMMITAGLDAIEDYMKLHQQIKDIMKMMSAKRYDCAELVANQGQKLQEEHELTVALKKEITALYKESLDNQLEKLDNKFRVFFADTLDEIQARTLINDTVATKPIVLAVMFEKSDKGYRFVVGKNPSLEDVSLRELAGRMREELSARGGGSEQMIQGSVDTSKEAIEKFFDKQ